MKKYNSRTLIRIRKRDKVKFEKLKKELSEIEDNKISDAEILRRTFNIPNLPDVLKEDAFFKKRRI